MSPTPGPFALELVVHADPGWTGEVTAALSLGGEARELALLPAGEGRLAAALELPEAPRLTRVSLRCGDEAAGTTRLCGDRLVLFDDLDGTALHWELQVEDGLPLLAPVDPAPGPALTWQVGLACLALGLVFRWGR